MIRNIPNKYTVSELAEEIDEFFMNTYDFLYLPCDFYVKSSKQYRINAMLDMDSLISSTLIILLNFTTNLKNACGENIKVKKYYIFLVRYVLLRMLDYRVFMS